MITLDDIDTLGIPRSEIYQLASDIPNDPQRDARVAAAIASAVDVIATAYNNVGKPVPASTITLKTIAVDIAVYRLFGRRGGEVPKAHDEKFTRALGQLQKLVQEVQEESSPDGGITGWTRKPGLINRIDAMPQ
ncbi:MAG: DUF1320 family protein [Candidatus Kapabacteria bacterium]|nr:DUF1320 family protein [Candidatus Kapabacteria bacterium]